MSLRRSLLGLHRQTHNLSLSKSSPFSITNISSPSAAVIGREISSIPFSLTQKLKPDSSNLVADRSRGQSQLARLPSSRGYSNASLVRKIPVLFHINAGMEEVLADYVHQELTRNLMPNNIMTFSKQLLTLFFLLFFLLPLRHASKPKKCPSSRWGWLSCGPPSEVPIRFPFCDHKGFNLRCNNINKTVLHLPMSGAFLVESIDYLNQRISISDPDNCLAKRLLTFNLSGSPFSSPFYTEHTFFTCPGDVVLPSSYRSIPCLSNSTSSFYATTSYEQASSSAFRSCQIVKRLDVPASYINSERLLLEWHSPNCTSYEMDYLRCGFKNKASLEVKCFGNEPGMDSVIFFCYSLFLMIQVNPIGDKCSNVDGSDSPRQEIVESREMIGRATNRGLDQCTIETYKKMELGESIKLPGTNGTACLICLSEYASKETVRFIPECDHCFHVECIDVWLKIHGSCPICRDSRALR
uniref:RING-type E3 ubiquitin transferase n=1 Tax=Brassica oleracea var. oleracea TaxID=109376 RepID=A0A0D3BNS9_BRAOL